MNRKTFDTLFASGGVAVAVMLLVAGGLLSWGHSFVNHQVRTQLAAQKIFFPPHGDKALAPSPIGPYLNKYAGQQMFTGQQADAYANHFIAVHLQEIGGGQTYAQLTALAQANPKNTISPTRSKTMFKGETLRGLLLNAYAFGKIATLAGIGAIVAFVGAALMLLLSGLGLWHRRRTPADVEILSGQRQRSFGASTGLSQPRRKAPPCRPSLSAVPCERHSSPGCPALATLGPSGASDGYPVSLPVSDLGRPRACRPCADPGSSRCWHWIAGGRRERRPLDRDDRR